MKSNKNLIASFKGRYRQARRDALELADVLAEGAAMSLTPYGFQQARDLAENILQCVHEMNAYYNAANDQS